MLRFAALLPLLPLLVTALPLSMPLLGLGDTSSGLGGLLGVGGSNGLPMNSGSANSVTDNIPLTGSSGNGVTNNLPLVGSSGSGVTNNPSAAWLEWQLCNQQPAVPRLNYEQPPHRRRDRQRRRGHRHGPLRASRYRPRPGGLHPAPLFSRLRYVLEQAVRYGMYLLGIGR